MKFLITMSNDVKAAYIFIILVSSIGFAYLTCSLFNEVRLQNWYQSERAPFPVIRVLMSFDVFKITIVLFLFILIFFIIYFISIFFRRFIEIYENYLIIKFGIILGYRKIYYKDIKQIRYKNDDEFFRRGFACGEKNESLVLEMKETRDCYLSVANTERFYEIIKEKIHQVDEDDAEVIM